MGQKTNPKGFRLVTTQKHLSNYCNTPRIYASLIKDDFKIRNQLNNLFGSYLTLSNIEINRIRESNNKEEFINITVFLLYPRKKHIENFMSNFFINFKNEKEKLRINAEESNLPVSLKRAFYDYRIFIKIFAKFILKRNLKKFIYGLKIQNEKYYKINIKFTRSKFEDASIISKFIGSELARRVPYRRVIKTTIQKIEAFKKQSKIQGLKIELSGRLNGIEIARSEWKRKGNIPLHTLEANLDYTHEIINTIHGIIGIKVWLFKGLTTQI
jgi:small subunit ribosomal protein S3